MERSGPTSSSESKAPAPSSALPARDPAQTAAVAELARAMSDYSHPPRRRRVLLPALLFAATCGSTFFAAATAWNPVYYLVYYRQAPQVIAQHWQEGLLYMAAVMGILLMHEMGHFVMTLRYRIPASFPYFIPMPLMLFGTMGAVIGMDGSRANRRQMFDQGIAGPLAGLVVALPVICIGILLLPETATEASGAGLCFRNPLAIQWMMQLLRPDYVHAGKAAGEVLFISTDFNPLLVAGYVGLLITGLNMVPISQLDGGHVAYALLGRRAHVLARALLIGSILFVLITETYTWVLMVVIVILIGTDHPPTADDHARLGPVRRILGFASLAIPVLCFNPWMFRDLLDAMH